MPDTTPHRVPERVMARVRAALDDLRHAADGMRRARETLDDPRGPVGGGGRYEAEAVHAQTSHVAHARAELASFQDIAAARGVDADAVIAALGGVPDLTPSPAAAAYLAGMRDRRPAPAAAR